jgi:tetratricopeptide (TPR) repeat protein
MPSDAKPDGAGQEPDGPLPSLVADRYRVQHRLTKGGMAEILVAIDETTGERVALKRLFERRGKTAMMLFEREYHTLSSLQHPCIVRVYDYGIDGAPFYTMELLDGRDLTVVAPAPYLEACRYLRDVASSLALLHARHLLHRDVSPRNVRITAEGRCKLLDFGALTSFGIPNEMIGTPPGMPPETLYGVPLDQRVDLYAVGALGYWLLTGRHAYPTRDPHDLPALWAMPIAPPSAFAPGVPEALDQLILSLLSQDRVERPSSAAEVMDQLSAIAGLPPEEHQEVAHSYLASPKLVGRGKQLKLIESHVLAAAKGRGASLLFEGLGGTGKTRLIDDATLAGRLAGATVVRVDAELHTGPFGVPRAVAEGLLRAAPTIARRAAGKDLPLLSQLVPALVDSAPASPGDVAQYPGERRAQIQSALHRWITAVATERPLSILCDNVHAADQASIGFLLGLARQVETTQLFLLSTRRLEEEATDVDAFKKFREASESVDLGPLAAEAVHELAVALFGDVPNVHRFAEWLDAGAAGNPLRTLELARYAVAQDIARYVDGAWLLPLDLPKNTATLGSGVTEWALGKLSREARATAEALSIHDGALTLELAAALVGNETGAKPFFAVVDELAHDGILASHQNEIRFTRATVRSRFFESIEPERRKRLHRTLADALIATKQSDFRTVVSAGWHLIHAGDETRGADLLARSLAGTQARALLVENDLHAAVPGLEAAYAVYKAQGRSLYERAPLLVALVGAGYYVDWRLAQKYGDEGMAVFSEALGLTLATRLRPFLGGFLSLIVGIVVARVRFGSSKRREGKFKELFVALLSCATYLVAISLIRLDAPSARRHADVLSPLRVLGKKLAPAGIAEYCQYLALFADNQLSTARTGFLKLIGRLNDDRYYRSLNEEGRKLFRGGALYALGILETFRDTGDTLHYATELESQGFKFYDIVAGRLRIAHHAYRAEMELIPQYSERLDVHAIQFGSAWQVELWSPAALSTAYANIGDASGIKTVTDSLRTLSREIPHFRVHADRAEGTHFLLKGNPEKAIEILERLYETHQFKGYPGCVSSIATLAVAYNQAGEHEKAKALCEEVLANLSSDDREFVVFTLKLELQLALAHAALGDTAGAAAQVDALIERFGHNRGPATLASLHQARARVAMMAGNPMLCRRHAQAMGEVARATNNPSLIAQWKRLDRKTQQGILPTTAAGVLGHTVGATTVPQPAFHDDDDDDDLGATDLFETGDTVGSGPVSASPNSEPPPAH